VVVPAPRVLKIIELAARAGVKVWLDGGGGVDPFSEVNIGNMTMWTSSCH